MRNVVNPRNFLKHKNSIRTRHPKKPISAVASQHSPTVSLCKYFKKQSTSIIIFISFVLEDINPAKP
jgi:hypothetical protein